MVYLLPNLQKPWVTTLQSNGNGSESTGRVASFISTPYLYVVLVLIGVYGTHVNSDGRDHCSGNSYTTVHTQSSLNF